VQTCVFIYLLILSPGTSVRKSDIGVHGTYKLYKIQYLLNSEIAKRLELPKLHFSDKKRV